MFARFLPAPRHSSNVLQIRLAIQQAPFRVQTNAQKTKQPTVFFAQRP